MASPNRRIFEFADLIEINRGFYYHWALYIGSFSELKEVVDLNHFDSFVLLATERKFIGDFLRSPMVIELTTNTFGSLSVSNSEAGVNVIPLEKCLGDDEYQICNPSHQKLPVAVIMKSILRALTSPIKYDPVRYNCEHFVHKLRCGVERSNQVFTDFIFLAGLWFPYARILSTAYYFSRICKGIEYSVRKKEEKP